MTTLVAFVSIDPHGPTAFYLASDSRITWKSHQRWDAARKVFASQRHPHAFAYCGDVVFPSLILSQLVELIDTGALFSDLQSPEEHHAKIASAVKKSFDSRENAPDQSFDILHVSRQGSSTRSKFTLWQLSYEKVARRWIDRPVDIPTSGSSLVLALGSGTAAVRKHERLWKTSEQGGTSRSIYSAFADALLSGGDVLTGGAPQLVGIYRGGPARSIGVIHNGMRYFCGLPLPDGVSFQELEWRDQLFQRIDGESMQLLKGAQRHTRPK